MTLKTLLLLALMVALVALSSSNNFLCRAQEGQCVENVGGECVNPDTEEPVQHQQQEEVIHEVQQHHHRHEHEQQQQQQQQNEVAAHENTQAVEEEPAASEQSIQREEEAILEEIQEEGPEPVQEEESPASETVQQVVKEDPKCPSREHVIQCAGEYLDTNGNGLLEREELETAIDKLPWLSRGVLKILGSIDKMMAKCDIDGDGAISIGYDMKHNGETCLATCFKRRAFKSAFFSECQSGQAGTSLT